MIDKIANNETNQEELNLHPTKDILEKLNYYRSLFGKVQDLTDAEFENLRKDIAKFFNLKSFSVAILYVFNALKLALHLLYKLSILYNCKRKLIVKSLNSCDCF